VQAYNYNHTDKGDQTLGQILAPKLGGGEMMIARAEQMRHKLIRIKKKNICTKEVRVQYWDS
jgi:hypothetical protein